ncbi:cathepsin W isoform X2 [Zalophus californianus]|uniref:Cathepsin W isoform X2 n=1 Tax=Zalophus californianus TaxID=9704 RepID=A0A6J2BWP2_ZALCA|nr:cathepsin W isoform X2 [Zalophus californianus]
MAVIVYLSCLLALLVAGLPQGIKGSLRNKIQYNRSYSNPEEYARRLDIFARNLAHAQQLEAEDLGTAEFGVTPFSDLTEEEFGQLYGHQRMAGEAPSMGRKVGSEESGESLPSSCDWRRLKGIISPIRQQVPAPIWPSPASVAWRGAGRERPGHLPTAPLPGQENCNCCWAMATAGNIEALWGIKYNQVVQVSVQELLDCGRCGDGCRGGFVWDAFITVLNNSGLASERDYPFQGDVKPHKCLAKKYKTVAWIQDFIMLQDNEKTIARYLATEGPITVTINMKLLQQYQKGVIKATPATCDPQVVDHSVLLVGFGKSKSVAGRRAEGGASQPHPRRSIPYWILKNSWGAEWGEEGYFRLHRGSNACGITKYPLTARVDLPVKKRPVSCPP